MSIPRVGSGRSDDRPSGRVGFGSGIALKCIPSVVVIWVSGHVH